MVFLVKSRVHEVHKILVNYLYNIFHGNARLQMSGHLSVVGLQLRYATRVISHLNELVADRRLLTVVLRDGIEAVQGGHFLIGADITRLVA